MIPGAITLILIGCALIISLIHAYYSNENHHDQ
jgi:hypothetical protein